MALPGPIELMPADDCACKGGSHPCGCDEPSSVIPACGCIGGDDFPLAGLSAVEPLGEPMTVAALAAAAIAVADYLGVDIGELVSDGIDAVLNLLGINTCSSDNREKYRHVVATAPLDVLMGWLRAKKVRWVERKINATGNCNKYALGLAARRAMRESKRNEQQGGGRPAANDATGPAAIEARRAQRRQEFASRSFADNSACRAALRAAEAEDKAAGLWAVWRERLQGGRTFRMEMDEACRQRTGTGVVNRCPPRPIELELMGIREEYWCRGTDADFAPLIAAVRDMNLTAEERTRLLATPIEQRPAAFKALVEAREGMAWWVWALIILGVGTAIGVVAWKVI